MSKIRTRNLASTIEWVLGKISWENGTAGLKQWNILD